MNSQKIIFVAGPTAVGKTDIVVELAGQCRGEIISCDSMQIYKQVSIVSNKPSKAMLKKVRHYCVDIVSMDEEFDVATFNRIARAAIEDIQKRDKVPIIVAGSGMYMQTLLDGIFEGKEDEGKDLERRRQMEQRVKEQGSDVLYAELKRVDPDAAARIHANDTRRIIRAIEVFEKTGEPISQVRQSRCGLWGKYDISVFVLNRDREQLYNRINARVEAMFETGLVDEIRNLNGIPLSLSAGQIIGINEVRGYLGGEYDLKQARYLIQRNTRHLAKRQLTWFRRDKRFQWVVIEEGDTIKDIVERLIKSIHLVDSPLF